MVAKGYRTPYFELTPTEERIRDWICSGANNVTIARYLRTTEQSVKNMIGRMFRKVGCSDRIEFFLMSRPLKEQVKERIRDPRIRQVHLTHQLAAVDGELAILEGKPHEKALPVFDLHPHAGGLAGARADLGQSSN
jgi:DNA-binding CsgD family transcriptional regulator